MLIEGVFLEVLDSEGVVSSLLSFLKSPWASRRFEGFGDFLLDSVSWIFFRDSVVKIFSFISFSTKDSKRFKGLGFSSFSS
jgi:hypothetical protein